jgi:hypothetical protein
LYAQILYPLRQATKHVSIVLLLVLSFYLSPRFYVHELYGHEDTHCHSGASSAIEPLHHHCEILQLSESVFLVEKPFPVSFYTTLLSILSEALFTCFLQEGFENIHLRGPPVDSMV